MNSSFQDLYKKGLDMGEQQKQRQKDLLKQQKLRRQQNQDDSRPLQKPGGEGGRGGGRSRHPLGSRLSQSTSEPSSCNSLISNSSRHSHIYDTPSSIKVM